MMLTWHLPDESLGRQPNIWVVPLPRGRILGAR
jgi:hypothetical protein